MSDELAMALRMHDVQWERANRLEAELADTRKRLATPQLHLPDERRMTPATVASVSSKGSPKEIVRLSEEARAALVAQAQAEGVSKSDIMRRAIYRELGIADDPT